jgi:hypothetical protein
MPDSPRVDFSQIHFPSDNLTIGALRTLHRDGFDSDITPHFFRDNSRMGADRTVGLILYTERALALSAFNHAVGNATKEAVAGFNRDDFANDLQALYVRYGIASGAHHAEQLIRSFENEAVAQVPDVSGPAKRR